MRLLLPSLQSSIPILMVGHCILFCPAYCACHDAPSPRAEHGQESDRRRSTIPTSGTCAARALAAAQHTPSGRQFGPDGAAPAILCLSKAHRPMQTSLASSAASALFAPSCCRPRQRRTPPINHRTGDRLYAGPKCVIVVAILALTCGHVLVRCSPPAPPVNQDDGQRSLRAPLPAGKLCAAKRRRQDRSRAALAGRRQRQRLGPMLMHNS